MLDTSITPLLHHVRGRGKPEAIRGGKLGRSPRSHHYATTPKTSNKQICAKVSGHRRRSVASRQNAGPVAQHDQPPRILPDTASIDRPGNGQVVVPVDDLFLAGAFAASLNNSTEYLASVSDTL
jgi:hypothetical protein